MNPVGLFFGQVGQRNGDDRFSLGIDQSPQGHTIIAGPAAGIGQTSEDEKDGFQEFSQHPAGQLERDIVFRGVGIKT